MTKMMPDLQYIADYTRSLVTCAHIEVQGMQEENRVCKARGEDTPYSKQDFDDVKSKYDTYYNSFMNSIGGNNG